jgi:hypothetical protein
MCAEKTRGNNALYFALADRCSASDFAADLSVLQVNPVTFARLSRAG